MFGSSDVAPPKRGEYTGHYPCSEAADGSILDRKLQKYARTRHTTLVAYGGDADTNPSAIA
jgi:hypothetical protein